MLIFFIYYYIIILLKITLENEKKPDEYSHLISACTQLLHHTLCHQSSLFCLRFPFLPRRLQTLTIVQSLAGQALSPLPLQFFQVFLELISFRTTSYPNCLQLVNFCSPHYYGRYMDFSMSMRLTTAATCNQSHRQSVAMYQLSVQYHPMVHAAFHSKLLLEGGQAC